MVYEKGPEKKEEIENVDKKGDKPKEEPLEEN
jgi:hypothetical protein